MWSRAAKARCRTASCCASSRTGTNSRWMYSMNAISTPIVITPASRAPAEYHSTTASPRLVRPSTSE